MGVVRPAAQRGLGSVYFPCWEGGPSASFPLKPAMRTAIGGARVGQNMGMDRADQRSHGASIGGVPTARRRVIR